RVAPQGLDHLVRHLGDANRSRLLELEDRDPGRDEARKRLGDVLVLDRLMADVEDDADVPAEGRLVAESLGGGVRVEMLAEVGDRLRGRLEEAVRLGLQGERDGPA